MKVASNEVLTLFLTTNWKSEYYSFENGLREVNPYEYEIVVPKEDGDKIRGHFANFFKASEKEKQNLLKDIIGDSESN